MENSIRPKVLISKCIEYEACRYNGGIINSPIIQNFQQYVDFIPVCPEVAIGLPIPRESIRLLRVDGKITLVTSMTGDDFTDKMNDFSEKYVNQLSGIDGCILKSRSPSCGIKDVKLYTKIGKVPAINTKQIGLFAKCVMVKFNNYAIEDEGRLTNIHIREHFLTKLFTLTKFRNLPMTMKALVDFQSANKYLFMAYNQSKLKVAGKLVANHEGKGVEQVFAEYKEVLFQILAKKATIATNINVLLHVFGYFSKELISSEKALFLDQLELYREKKIPLIVVTTMLKSWVVRFDEKYLAGQNYFEPFPKDMMHINNSGKGRII